MTFNDLLNEIEKLIGLDLDSIARAEGIRITKVDRPNNRVELVTSAGRPKTRSFDELKKVWDRLCKEPAIHVDSVLRGSSSSRNQPETILANLPYVEWFRFDNKKHITLRTEPTHGYGTLKQMDEFSAEEIKERLRNSAKVQSEVVVISDDVRTASEIFESNTGMALEPVEAGIYRQVKDSVAYLIVSRGQVNGAIDPGTYPIIKGISRPQNGRHITVDGREFFLVLGGGLNCLISLE